MAFSKISLFLSIVCHCLLLLFVYSVLRLNSIHLAFFNSLLLLLLHLLLSVVNLKDIVHYVRSVCPFKKDPIFFSNLKKRIGCSFVCSYERRETICHSSYVTQILQIKNNKFLLLLSFFSLWTSAKQCENRSIFSTVADIRSNKNSFTFPFICLKGQEYCSILFHTVAGIRSNIIFHIISA